jgi:hypothetical protein
VCAKVVVLEVAAVHQQQLAVACRFGASKQQALTYCAACRLPAVLAPLFWPLPSCRRL